MTGNSFNNCFLKTKVLLFLCLWVGGLLISVNCAGLTAKKQAAQARAEEQKQNFDALSQALFEKTLKKGVSQKQIQDQFGAPQDRFQSGSPQSQMEIWTYRPTEDSENPDHWQIIRLYFINKKLTSWTF